MNYSYILDNSIYSYSRLKCYKQCKYAFFLKYILGYNEDSNFFSEFGSLMHECLEKYLSKEYDKDSIVLYYMSEFKKKIIHPAPTYKIYNNYFEYGLNYLNNIDFRYQDILSLEEKVEFKIGDYNFLGFIDCVVKEGNDINIIDHKSHSLKKRSNRAKPTLGDKELDEYLNQLYLYSIPIEEKYHILPKKLEFNCFKNNTWISENFNVDNYNKAKQWAIDTIEDMKKEELWKPTCDEYYCKNLCGLNNVCEYYIE